MKSIPVYYTPKMLAPSLSDSPSSLKPGHVVADWQASGIPITIHDVPPIDIEDIYLAHDPGFVDGVLSGHIVNGFENYSMEIAATLLYTNAAMRDAARHAVQHSTFACAPVSGFHHALYYMGSSFCTFNGLMIAAQWLLKHGLAKRIGILDLDFHYGNGTDQIIGKLGLHRQVKHFTAGNDYYQPRHALPFLDELYNQIRFMSDCDVILFQAGADPHIKDPLGGFLTSEQLATRDAIVFTECRQRGLPVAWNLAGGYQKHADKSTDWGALCEIHRTTLAACSSALNTLTR